MWISHEQRLEIIAALKGESNEGAKQTNQRRADLCSRCLPPSAFFCNFFLDFFASPVEPGLEQNCKIAKLMRNLGIKHKS